MRLLYMGTPQFAVPPLAALIKAGHEIAGVVTRIDKPAGRGRTVTAPPVKLFAVERGLAVFQPKRVRDPEFLDTLRRLEPEAIVAAAYGQILPAAVLHLPRYGCINIHASLLPAYRGAAPINWAIIRGEERTGITIMQMDEGMDTGAVLLQESIRIDPEDTAGTLTEKLSELGARLIAEALPGIVSGALKPVAQDNARATLAPLLKKEDGLIDWTLPAKDIHDRVRGFTPWPGAYTFLEGTMVKLLKTGVAPGSLAAGVIAAKGNTLEVGTGKDLIRLVTVQPAGKKPMAAGDFLRGHRITAGTKFEAPISKS
ncbi:MAG: methionyl-tRNA formyltransferase [Nitrospirae bacterium GWD2_57_9]|nr:MAG: methionyl-tRNA formyltransferase [Nitrospirae bacterium GWD2_57_9]